jgi:hypothetical protein
LIWIKETSRNLCLIAPVLIHVIALRSFATPKTGLIRPLQAPAILRMIKIKFRRAVTPTAVIHLDRLTVQKRCGSRFRRKMPRGHHRKNAGFGRNHIGAALRKPYQNTGDQFWCGDAALGSAFVRSNMQVTKFSAPAASLRHGTMSADTSP